MSLIKLDNTNEFLWDEFYGIECSIRTENISGNIIAKNNDRMNY